MGSSFVGGVGIVLGEVLVTWLFVNFYVVVWRLQGPLPPLKVGATSLVLNA